MLTALIDLGLSPWGPGSIRFPRWDPRLLFPPRTRTSSLTLSSSRNNAVMRACPRESMNGLGRVALFLRVTEDCLTGCIPLANPALRELMHVMAEVRHP